LRALRCCPEQGPPKTAHRHATVKGTRGTGLLVRGYLGPGPGAEKLGDAAGEVDTPTEVVVDGAFGRDLEGTGGGLLEEPPGVGEQQMADGRWLMADS